MMNKGFLFLQTFGHFCVDAVCASIVIGATQNIIDSFIFFVLYNFFAFCMQPFAGLILDKQKTVQPKHYILLSFILLLFGFIPNSNIWLIVILAGLGNCLFHVGAGMLVLIQADKKMTPLGVFVSSGALGLFLGTIFATNITWQYLLFLSLIILILMNLNIPKKITVKSDKKTDFLCVIFLCICIAIRSFMGFMPLTDFEKTPLILLMITIGVFLGKFLGGFLCDKYGIKKIVYVSTSCVLLLFLFSFSNPYLWAIVQMIINLSMPITLYLMYKSMPKYPAFSFGLSASCLVIGFVIALLLSNIDIPKACFLILFMLNSIIILYTTRKIK